MFDISNLFLIVISLTILVVVNAAHLTATSICGQQNECCDFADQYKTQTDLGLKQIFDVGCKNVNGRDLRVTTDSRTTPKISQFSATDGLFVENGRAGVGVDQVYGARKGVDATNLFDAAQEAIELNWNNLVIGGKLYFSGFNNRVAKSAGTYQFSKKTKDGQYTVNSVEIKCGIRELPERFYGHRAVDYINVAGYVDNGVVDLSPFGQINHCLVLYKDGPGFALAGVTWQRDDSNNKPGYDVAVERLLNVYQKHRNDLPDPDSP